MMRFHILREPFPQTFLILGTFLLLATIAAPSDQVGAPGATSVDPACAQQPGDQVYYVDVDSRCGPCSDGYSKKKNSAVRPFCTLAHAIEVASPGDTYLVQDGRYGSRKNFTASGNRDRPITYRALGDHAVIGVFSETRDEDFEPTERQYVWAMKWKKPCCDGYGVYQTHYDPIVVDDPNPSRFILDPKDGPVRMARAKDLDILEEQPGTWLYQGGKFYVHPYDDRRPTTESADIVIGYRKWGLNMGKGLRHMILDGFRVEYSGAYTLVVEGSEIELRNLWVTSGLSMRGSNNLMENITATHKISRTAPQYLWYESGRGTGLGLAGANNTLRNAHIFHNWNNFNMRGSGNHAMNLHIHGAPNHCWQSGYMKDALVQNAVIYNCQDGVGYVAGGVKRSVFEGIVTQGGLLLQEHRERNSDIVFRNSIFTGCKLTFGGGGVQSCAFQGTITVENSILLCAGGERATASYCRGPERKKTVYELDEYLEACREGKITDCMTLRGLEVINHDHDSVLAGGRWRDNTDSWDVHLSSKSSPAYDTGSTKTLSREDFEGHPRPQGKGFEIGADELDERVDTARAAPARPAPSSAE